MSSNITVGSIVYGAAGIGCKVLKVHEDALTIETVNGEGIIPFSRVLKIEPPPLINRLRIISTLNKLEAIEGLNELLAELSTDSIYEASLDIDTYLGTFIRRLLADIKPSEFAEIGKDGSEGKYGVLTFPDSPTPENLLFNEILAIGYRVTHVDPYHCYGADVGTIELIDSCGDCHVQWDSDSHIGRYSMDSLKSMRF